MGIDILGIDIMGVDILGIDIVALPHPGMTLTYFMARSNFAT